MQCKLKQNTNYRDNMVTQTRLSMHRRKNNRLERQVHGDCHRDDPNWYILPNGWEREPMKQEQEGRQGPSCVMQILKDRSVGLYCRILLRPGMLWRLRLLAFIIFITFLLIQHEWRQNFTVSTSLTFVSMYQEDVYSNALYDPSTTIVFSNY